jgi:hypothetical protein
MNVSIRKVALHVLWFVIAIVTISAIGIWFGTGPVVY